MNTTPRYEVSSDATQAPLSFFQAWQRGVELVGSHLFGNGSAEGLQQATDKWHLCPDLRHIKDVIGVMSSGEKIFLAAMVSFYNAKEGGALLRRIGFRGLADLGVLDLQRRQVIATLVMNYDGW